MTQTAAQTPPTGPRLDPRCGHLVVGNQPGRWRCQLWAGHHTPHALMFVRAGQRIVRTWTDAADEEAQDLARGYQSLPWMLGYPMPAWQEPS